MTVRQINPNSLNLRKSSQSKSSLIGIPMKSKLIQMKKTMKKIKAKSLMKPMQTLTLPNTSTQKICPHPLFPLILMERVSAIVPIATIKMGMDQLESFSVLNIIS